MKKIFVSIIWGYSTHMYDFSPEENYHLHILKEAKSLGFSTVVIIKDDLKNIERDPNFDKDTKVFYYRNIFQFLFLLIKFSITNSLFYVNSYEWQSFIVPFIAKKTIFMAHTQPKRSNFKKQKIQNFVYRFFTKIRLNNEEEKKFLLQQGINENKLEIVPLIVSQKVFYKIDNLERKDLVYFGNITEKKNLLTILKAFDLIKLSRLDIKLNIIGNMWDKNISNYINNSKNKDSIILQGFLPNDILAEKLNQNLLYLNSSLDEGQCVAVYDAALCGLGLCLPNIMSFIGVFKDKALFHDVYDFEKLANNINTYLDDKELISNHVFKNIEMIKNEYSINVIEEKLKKLIISI
ncbi:MAG: glycosyltransferase [Aliarcobacter sp.]|nr:glycosyltransferase [Aliarcobacter sp.]MBP9766103.1 glycosyltransferase [Candidatus Paceibacterota bacterium]